MQGGDPPLFRACRSGTFLPGRPGCRVTVFRILPDPRLHPVILRCLDGFRRLVSFAHPARCVSDMHTGSHFLQRVGNGILPVLCSVSSAVGFPDRRIRPHGRRSLRTPGRGHRPGSGAAAHSAARSPVRSCAHQSRFGRHTAVRALYQRMLRACFRFHRLPGIGHGSRCFRQILRGNRCFHIFFFCDADSPAAPGKLIQIIAFFVQDCRLL